MWKRFLILNCRVCLLHTVVLSQVGNISEAGIGFTVAKMILSPPIIPMYIED